MKKHTLIALASLASALLLAGCATGPSVAELNALSAQIVKSSFRDQSHVKLTRLTETDETNLACSEADVAGKPLDDKTARAIEAVNMKAIKWPSDGKFIGDWKEGEKIAQSGRGLTWSDSATMENGGNCYNCHQIDKAEISYGTIGPSLYNYGKIRGVSSTPRAAKASMMMQPIKPAPICNTLAPGLAKAMIFRASSRVQQVCTPVLSIPAMGGCTGREPVASKSVSKLTFLPEASVIVFLETSTLLAPS